MESKSRLFFALWPDDEARDKLAQLNQSIEGEGFKPVAAHNFHVTLVFIGFVNQACEFVLKQLAAGISAEPLEIAFDHLSYWPKPKVVCLTSQQPSPQAACLAQALNNEVTQSGIATDFKLYIPHITLARHVSAFVERDCEPIIFRADSFCLVESCGSTDGVLYKVKDRWSLVKTGL